MMSTRELITWIDNKTILTATTAGFLALGFTHTINVYVGCTFAGALCGLFCYAQHWRCNTGGRPWGLYGAKRHIVEPYRKQYDRIKLPRRGAPRPLRIYMSSVTDPYVPQEKALGLTRRLLGEMLDRTPDVLVIQTHSPLVLRDLDLIRALSPRCELWVSLTVETDMDPMPGLPPHAPPPARRIEVLKAFRDAGVRTQATISPILPIAGVEAFARRLDAACDRVIVDHYLIGDGSKRGWRTKRTNFPKLLEEAGFGEWTKLEKMKEVQAVLAGILGPSRVLESREGFNAVGSRVSPQPCCSCAMGDSPRQSALPGVDACQVPVLLTVGPGPASK
jgi:DNA repair photolyase